MSSENAQHWKRVAVVTGSNKGIGLAIVRALCKNFDGDVLVTARDTGRGEAACATLKQEGLSPKFHQLDVTDSTSIARLAEFLRVNYGGVDVLVNNAGMYYMNDSDASLAEKARVTMDVNFFGLLNVCRALFPILKVSGRVVQVASGLGHLKRVKNTDIQEQLVSPSLREDELVGLAESYCTATVKGDASDSTWPTDAAYTISKVFVIGLTRIQARDMSANRPDARILINACCPGFVKTDLNGHRGHLTTEEGAETPVFLALLPDGSPNGLFYKKKEVCEW